MMPMCVLQKTLLERQARRRPGGWCPRGLEEEQAEAAARGIPHEVYETCPGHLLRTSANRRVAAVAVQKLARQDVVITTYTVLREEVRAGPRLASMHCVGPRLCLSVKNRLGFRPAQER